MRASHPAAPFTAAGISKIDVPRIALLETGRIIALPPRKSKRKSFLALHALTTAYVTSAKRSGGRLLVAYANAWLSAV